MIVYIVRHGHCYGNVRGYMNGPRVHGIDTPLTKLGRRQAGRLNRHLVANWNLDVDAGWFHRDYVFDRIISSPMRRALETTILMRGRMKTPIEIRTEVCERDGLTFVDSSGKKSSDTGLKRPEIERMAEHITIPEDITDDGWWDGRIEPHSDCVQRAFVFATYLDELRIQDGKNLCVVTHGGFGDYLIRHLLRSGEDNQFGLANTGVTSIVLDGENEGRRLHYHNRTKHLRDAT